MNQNISPFYVITVVAVLSLMGVEYATPFISGDLSAYEFDWGLVNDRLDQDTGVEMTFPMYSLIFFTLATVIASATQKLKVPVFVIALVNMLYVVAIPSILENVIVVPFYRMQNGYYLHVVSSLALLVLSISILKRVKPRKSRIDPLLLDDDF